ncbi:uncharacterized protein VTP21DRAFT_6991 [Calcarisporiella thermophila]|uniref:uncharacterized protein n=1 Tax=Calcarisporiella thermophila TaxID=911321 RepID=UPI0037435457
MHFLSSGDGLRLQLKLNSLGDLHRLLSAYFILENISPPDLFHGFTSKNLTESGLGSRRCTLLNRHFPTPIQDKIFKPSVHRPSFVSRRLADYLFYVYVSDCNYGFQHPDRASFLESYHRGELSSELICTALANSAIHLLCRHGYSLMMQQIRKIVGDLLAQARLCLEEVFDTPSLYIVLSFQNLEDCMRKLLRYDDAYVYHRQAVLMALALGLETDDPNEQDEMQIELRRRIWSYLCHSEMVSVNMDGRPRLISLGIIRNSPKATVHSKDGERYKLFLASLFVDIEFSTKFERFQDIDWTQLDIEIVQNVIGIAALLQQDLHSTLRNGSTSDEELRQMLSNGVGYNFWIDWCSLWQRFIESEAPPQRIEGELMKELRVKAMNEYARKLINENFNRLSRVYLIPRWVGKLPYVAKIGVKCKYLDTSSAICISLLCVYILVALCGGSVTYNSRKHSSC